MPVKLGARLTDDEELLLRHATEPGWIVDGRPSRQLFALRKIDKGYLSVERESLAGGAQAALEHFNAAVRSSVSVWGVTVAEVHDEELQAYAQPSKKLPAHAVIDLANLQPGEQQAAGDRLTAHAARRGCLAPLAAAANVTPPSPEVNAPATSSVKAKQTLNERRVRLPRRRLDG